MLSEPKAGSSRAEYEDAWFVPREAAADPGSGEPRGWTVAVADGASESMLAGAWARKLVRAVGGRAAHDLDAEEFADLICAAAARWPAYVNRYVRRRERLGRPVAWYEESKLEQGAYATALGISFRRDTDAGPGTESADGGTWSAAALGDACCFHVRDARLAQAFPIESPAGFDSSPHLAGTRAPNRELLGLRTVARRGTWRPGDAFYLATDAAAQWFLAEAEAGGQPWRQLDRVLDAAPPGGPRGWLAELRDRRRMRNDDVTVVRCRLGRETAL